MKNTVILAILDGWGVGANDESNPIYAAAPRTIDFIEKNFPCGALQASGITVGLPWEEEGNSEVGHTTIGCGATIYQHYPRITLSVESGEFAKNPALSGAFAHARSHDGAVHLVGLVTAGNVHASMEHVHALLKMAANEKCSRCYLHLISDGRDSPPKSFADLARQLSAKMAELNVGEIASVVGRFNAMNRDEHWDRTQKGYASLVDENLPAKTPEEAANAAYMRNFNDEYLEPARLSAEPHPVRSGDAVVFWNFREDSMRQISACFLDPAFAKFPVEKFDDLYVATMTEYGGAGGAHVAFPNERVTETLGKAVSDAGLRQLRIAETQKYAHITYFFNGLRNETYPEEYRVLVPSIDTNKPEQHPEMMATAITDRALNAIVEGTYDFIALNYANADILAHTGNYDATVAAVKILDKELERLVNAAYQRKCPLVITSDHGNAEVLIDFKGNPETKHNTSPVPIYVVDPRFRRKKPLAVKPKLEKIGILADVAPTVLALLGAPKPLEMGGESLLPQLSFRE